MFRLNRRSLMPFLLVAAMQVTMVASGCGQRAGSQVDDGVTASTTSGTNNSHDTTLFTGTTSDTPLAYNSTATASATPSETPAATQSAGATQSAQPPVATPSAGATQSAQPTPATPSTGATQSAQPSPPHGVLDPAFMLQAKLTQTIPHGILWFKTLEAVVQVHNPSLLIQETGTLTVTFTLNGKQVEQQTLKVSLNPGEIRDYSVRSKVKADTASASVTTN